MTNFVVDASVVIERLIRGIYTPNAQALFRQLTPNDTIIVPEFCLLECANVLWKQVRFQGMSQGQAETLLRDLRALPLKRIPAKAALNTALNIGLKHQLAIYDRCTSRWQSVRVMRSLRLTNLRHGQRQPKGSC